MYRVILAILVALSPVALAQATAPAAGGTPAPAPVRFPGAQSSPSAPDESLTLAPGDVITIHVLEAPDLDQTVQINDAGKVRLLLGGDVTVEGLTPGGAANAIAAALVSGHYMLAPHVSVLIERYSTQNVSVVGEVHTPGSYFISTKRTILDILAMAGGLTADADRHITIQRAGTGELISYDASNNGSDVFGHNVLVFPGDRVFVPKVGLVYLIGDFNKPGAYPALTNHASTTVLQAVALAGGTPPTAVPSHARLVRRRSDGAYEIIDLPLSRMQKGKRADLALNSGDIIYVPYSYFRNIAVGIGTLLAAAASAAVYVH